MVAAHPFQLLFVDGDRAVYHDPLFAAWSCFAIALVYMFSGIWARAAYGWSRRRRRGTAETDSRKQSILTAEYVTQNQGDQLTPACPCNISRVANCEQKGILCTRLRLLEHPRCWEKS